MKRYNNIEQNSEKTSRDKLIFNINNKIGGSNKEKYIFILKISC